jgi:aminoglycoside phosphotransferase (APT) family kinase protein
VTTEPTPPSDAEIGAALRRWAKAAFGGDVDLVDEPAAITGGIDTFIFRFRLSGADLEGLAAGPLILRLYPSAARGASADKEAAVLGFLGEVGYPAPRLLAASAGTHDFGLPYLVMEQAPGKTVLDRVKAKPHHTAKLLDSMVAAQASLHGVDPTGWPLPRPTESEVDRRLRTVEGLTPSDPGLAAALRWLQDHRGDVRGEEPVVCHYDFHPLNALADDDGRLAVIDWANADLGDRHSDLARAIVLYEWAPFVAGSALERVVLRAARPWMVRRYQSTYARHLPIDGRRLHYWLAFHAADSWAEAASLLDGTFAKETRVDERVRAARLVGPGMARLFARLVPEAAGSTKYAP